jgi:tetratricopeptide (TPR) repeat protein
MFTKSVDRYRQLVDGAPDDIELRHALADTLNWMGESYREGGQLEDAVATYNEALKFQTELAAESPADSTIHVDLARSRYNRALALRDLNRLEDAEQDLRQSIQILDRPGPSDPAWQQGLARSRVNLGILLSDTERIVEANQEYLAAITLLEKLEEQNPQSPEYRAELAKAWMNRGNLLFGEHVRNAIGDPDPLATAEATFRLSVDKLRTLTSQFSNVPQYRKDLANSLNGLGAVLSQREQPADADHAWREAAGELESLIVRSPKVAEYHALLAQIHYNLALLHRRDPDSKPLIDFLRDAVAGQRRAIALSPTNVLYERTLATYERPYSRVLVDSGDYVAAAEIAEQLATHAADDPRQVYAAARVLAECAVAAEQDSALDANQLAERVNRYRAAATRLLESCRKRGLAINPDDFPGLE